MKPVKIILGTFVLLFALAMNAAADYTYPVVVLDGRRLPIEMPAIDEKGRTMVPVRAFFEEMGATVDWDEGARLITVSKAGTDIKLTLDQTTAYVNDAPVELETTPVNAGGRILVPLRFVAEAIGAQVAWNPETQEINIQTTVPPGPSAAQPATPSPAPGGETGDGQPDAAEPLNKHLGDWETPSGQRDLLIKGGALLLALVALLAAVKFYRRWRRELEEEEAESFDIVDSMKSFVRDGAPDVLSDSESDVQAEVPGAPEGLGQGGEAENTLALDGSEAMDEGVTAGRSDVEIEEPGDQLTENLTTAKVAIQPPEEDTAAAELLAEAPEASLTSKVDAPVESVITAEPVKAQEQMGESEAFTSDQSGKQTVNTEVSEAVATDEQGVESELPDVRPADEQIEKSEILESDLGDKAVETAEVEEQALAADHPAVEESATEEQATVVAPGQEQQTGLPVGAEDTHKPEPMGGEDTTAVEPRVETPEASSTSPTDVPVASVVAADPVEANYQEGLRLIQQEDWAQARFALVYPSVVKYKDSEELGYFIEAVEQYQESMRPDAADPYWAALMADYYCRKIPDTYDGSFNLEVQQLKEMCRNRYAELAVDPAALEKHELAEQQRKLREES